MALSPMQLDYVTKEEFGEFRDEFDEFKDDMGEFKSEMTKFKGEMNEFREETNNKFIDLERNLKDFSINGVEQIEIYIDKNVAILSNEIQQSKVEIITHINRLIKTK